MALLCWLVPCSSDYINSRFGGSQWLQLQSSSQACDCLPVLLLDNIEDGGSKLLFTIRWLQKTEHWNLYQQCSGKLQPRVHPTFARWHGKACEISGFHRGKVEVFALVVCYETWGDQAVRCWHFETTQYCRLQRSGSPCFVDCLTLKDGPINCHKMAVTNYKPTPCNSPEDRRPQVYSS